MKTNEIKTLTEALKELNEDYIDFLHSMADAVKEVKTTKKLWKNGEKPWLIKLGLALIVFPEPVISDVVGSLLIAAGTVQEGVRRRALHIEDIPKTFKNVMKELQTAEESLTGKLG
ncbi:MAG: hypothetical protein QHH12_00220 [Candidatus Bathyarchaeota archaeon]|jgi:hypothetical protein|nr:hypothetical protein [Candidatus Bathyarchaeota archaeon A05DMB-3]MDH7606182.1 hypothetical protein [Candidatus Bathyarchaeota archaeon]